MKIKSNINPTWGVELKNSNYKVNMKNETNSDMQKTKKKKKKKKKKNDSFIWLAWQH